MKINSISNQHNFLHKKNNLKNNSSNPVYNNLNSLNKDTVSFKGQRQSEPSVYDLRAMFTNKMEKIWDSATKLAQISGSSNIETWHIYLAALYSLKHQLKEIEQGLIKYNDPNNGSMLLTIQNMIDQTGLSISKEDDRKKIAKVVDEHIAKIKKDFMPQGKNIKLKNLLFNPRPSKAAMDDMFEAFSLYKSLGDIDETIDDSFPILAVGFSQDRKLTKNALLFRYNLQKAVMINDEDQKKKKHLSFFDDRADALWKNVSLRKDTVVLTDEENSSSTKHLISSFVNLINKPNQHYKNITPQNTDIIVLNEKTTFSFLNELVHEAKERKDRTTVIIVNTDAIHAFDGQTIKKEDIDTFSNIQTQKDAPNVRLIFTISKQKYYNATAKDGVFKEALEKHPTQTLPTLNANDSIKYLTNENGLAFLEQETGKKFSAEVIKKAIELTSKTKGNYPDKVIDLLNTVSAYNPDSDEVTPQMLIEYTKEAKSSNNNAQYQDEEGIIFNTGKTLNDIVGSPMVKAQAESIVKAIKNGTIGTRGYVISHSYDSAYGGGRLHTAQAIAGEAQIPMIIINAKDFALKDIDTLSQNADFSEIKIKNIVSSAVAQAEVNSNKCAMIFIKNFDNFAANPLTGISSIYEQKAFSQLLDEMDNIRKNKDVNIIVIGSMNMPELLDPNVQKPYKFLNSIDIYPPQDTEETKEVINYYINKMNLNIAGESEEERNKTIKNISETVSAMGASVVDIMYLLETAKNVSMERNKKAIDSSDLTEAYLQITSGRVNTSFISDTDKKIITSHEAGHAINIQVMHDLAKENNTPWFMPNKISFITLDPRGNYGGAVYHKNSGGFEANLENIMGNLVCSYGGYSAEKKLYNIHGSSGISQDMQNATYGATKAVLDYGIGKNTGVRHIRRNPDGTLAVTEHKKELIEKDVDMMTQGAMHISDAIIETYQDFIKEFTQKYYKKVGTGDCVVTAEEFKKELDAWQSSLTDKEKEKIETLKTNITNAMNSIKKGSYDNSPILY